VTKFYEPSEVKEKGKRVYCGSTRPSFSGVLVMVLERFGYEIAVDVCKVEDFAYFDNQYGQGMWMSRTVYEVPEGAIVEKDLRP
jgi:hypothetical protein